MMFILSKVAKSFGPKRVFSGLDLEINRNETLTVLGGSGSGKSVLLKMLIGLMRPDGGKILFDGADITRLAERELIPLRQRVGMLFQGAALFDSLTVLENVAYPLREHLKLDEKRIRETVAENLDLVGLPGVEDMRPSELSGGMRKRVGLARAIAMRPEAILYDEPTTGLDPANVHRILELIDSLKRKLQVASVVVTHDIEAAFSISDRVALLGEGRIKADGTVGEIRRSEDTFVRSFLSGKMEET